MTEKQRWGIPEVHNVRVKLSPARQDELHAELLQQTNQLRTTRESKASMMANFGKELKELEATTSSIALKLTQGFEYADVECKVRLEVPKKGKAQVIRDDTGDVVHIRDMRDSEKQVDMFAEDEQKSDKKSDEKSEPKPDEKPADEPVPGAMRGKKERAKAKAAAGGAS